MTCPDGLDRIAITGIAGTGFHGVFEHERREGQQFVVDVELGLDIRPAAEADDLSLTVDYGTVADGVHALIVGEPLDLIESLALRMLDVCLDSPSVRWASVTVHKPDAPITVPFRDVSVTTERSQQ